MTAFYLIEWRDDPTTTSGMSQIRVLKRFTGKGFTPSQVLDFWHKDKSDDIDNRSESFIDGAEEPVISIDKAHGEYSMTIDYGFVSDLNEIWHASIAESAMEDDREQE